jgi:outer membrane immunogenic protein
LGGQLGAQWMESRSSEYYASFSGSKDLHDTSFMGGGQVGFNWKLAGIPLILGVEGDVIGADHDKRGELVQIGTDHIDGRSEMGIHGSIRGRVGWTINRVLLYGTGGVGFGDCEVTTIAVRDGVGSVSYDKRKTLVGWTVGGGVEYALPFLSHWSTRAEYRYMDLGSIDLTYPGGAIGGAVIVNPYKAKADFQTHAVSFGVNYKF